MRKLSIFVVLASVFIASACSSNTEQASENADSTQTIVESENNLSSAPASDNALTEEEQSAGWVLLFDGETMEKWHGFQKEDVPTAWEVEDGAIVLTGEGGGDIVTDEEYDNFELMLDWKISEGGNSGIMFNVSEDPKFENTYQTGPEMQVLDDERHPDAKMGKNNNRQAGSNYDLHPLTTPAVNPAGEYNSVRLVVEDGNVEHYLNGKKVVEYTLWSPEWNSMVAESKFASMPDYGQYKSGHIALQDHGDKVWFKNVKIRQL